ncbi:MAG: alpha/beta hydrolase [Firmicutes bacterium]|nr:alpha/beta hydrolase [Bacillota bacterium]
MIRGLKLIGLVVIGLLIILSIIPYLLPLQELPGKEFEPLYDSSAVLAVEGVKLHYRQWAEDGAEGVFLVHGFSGSTFSWRYTAPALAEEGYRVIAVDLPGFGLSERNLNFSPTADHRAELLWSLLESLDSGSDWHLVGHSMGGGVVAAMALQRPDQVQSVTLAAGAIPAAGRGRSSWIFHYPPLGRAVRHLATRVLLSEENVERALASAYGRAPTKDEFEGYYRPLLIKDSDAALVEMLKTRERDLLSDLADLQTPVLLIWGEEDEWVRLEEGYKLNSLLKRAELVVLEGEGHCPMETAPLEFNSSLLRFLAEQR